MIASEACADPGSLAPGPAYGEPKANRMLYL
jgi:hypothetical protein